MSRFYSHINTAKNIINLYTGEIPFSVFLKNFFSKEKKYGSRDRRNISSLCYNYFRVGAAVKAQNIDTGIVTGLFLCTDKPNEILEKGRPDWNEKIGLPLIEKIEISGIDVKLIFPFNSALSGDIDTKAFNTSFLIQPKLFVRVRPQKLELVKGKLLAAQISFEEVNTGCLAFANGTRLEDVLDINRDVVIQDYSSQRVGELMNIAKKDEPAEVWDCCAASGGKSIMAHDIFGHSRLTVSDVRRTIIQNLHKRFRDADIRNYQSFVADLTDEESVESVFHNKKFDFIICDAPCSGSGTWGRTPEQLMFFKEEEITRYSDLQKKICLQTMPFVKKGGYFLYVTCSVFQKENEEVTGFIQQNSALTLIKQELLKGYDVQADTMFATLFQLL